MAYSPHHRSRYLIKSHEQKTSLEGVVPSLDLIVRIEHNNIVLLLLWLFPVEVVVLLTFLQPNSCVADHQAGQFCPLAFETLAFHLRLLEEHVLDSVSREYPD